MMSPQHRSTEMSPQSRPGQMSSQSVGTGIYTQSKFTGLSSESSMGLTPHGMMIDQSKSGVPRSIAASATTQPRPGLTTGHLSVPSSSQHLTHMSMMDYSPQSGPAGLPPHSNASNRLLPTHSVPGGLIPPGSSSLTPQLGMSPGLSPLTTSESFTPNATTEGFSSMSHSEFLGRSTTETFSPYSTLSDFPPHSSANTDFSTSLSTGDFNIQSTTGGFPAQTNLVGFSPQTNPCGYPQHASSGGFTSHNSGSVIGHSSTESFAAHPSCGSFTPAPVNASGYPPHSTAQLYSTSSTTDILGYPGSRDFMMSTSTRDFPTYSASNQLTNQLTQEMSASGAHRDLQLNPNMRDFSLQSSSTGNSSISTIVGEHYSQQQSYADPLAHSSYQQDPLHTRTTPNEVPLLPDLRDSSLRHNFRDSSLPLYGNFRDPVVQDSLRTQQMQGSYRDMPLTPTMNTIQSQANTRTQGLQTSFKDSAASSAYREQEIIANYLESSVLNYRDPGDMGSCQEQTSPAYRSASTHASPSEQVLPSFSNPASHPSPQEQVLPNFSECASPRDQVLPPQPCRDNTGQMTTGDSTLAGFRDSMNSSTSTQQDLVGFRDSLTYTGYRESGNFNIGCEKPGSNTSDYASSTSSRHSDVTQSGRSSTYKDPNSVPGYNITDPQNNMKFKEDMSTCGDNTILPSFTESFDSTSPNDMNRKDGNSTLSHYKALSEYGSLKGSPASVSTEGTSAMSPFVNHHTGEMSPLANDYSHSYVRDPNTYQSKRMYGAHPHDSYSPAQYSDDGGGGHLTQGASSSYINLKDQFFPETSSIHTTMTTSTYSGPKNSIAKSDMTGCLSQTVVSDSRLSSGLSNVQDPSGIRSVTSIPGNHTLLDKKGQPRDAKPNYMYHGDRDPLDDTQTPSLGFHMDVKKASDTQTGTQTTDEFTEAMNYQPFLGSDSPSSNCPIGTTNKFPSVSSPTKSDSNSSPSTQERIVIKMKLLHANSAEGDDDELVEDASINDIGANNKNSVKYSMAKYTRWTIDSIINGSEEGSDGTGKEDDCKILHGEKDENLDKNITLKRISRQRISESCSDVKDSNLDTNKNLMKKSLKITITNPLRSRISSDEDCEVGRVKERKSEGETGKLKEKSEGEAGRTKERKSESEAGKVKEREREDGSGNVCEKTGCGLEKVEDNSDINVLEEVVVGVVSSSMQEDGLLSLPNFHDSKKVTRSRRTRSPSPTPSLDSCSSSSSVSQASVVSRSDSSVSSIHSDQGDSQEQGDLKKCSIVIKRIYTENNYSCYSSSLCEEKQDQILEEEQPSKRRPKRKAALEASERCHKTLRPLDYNTPKTAKVPVLDKSKEAVVVTEPPSKVLIENSSPDLEQTENSTPNKALTENSSPKKALTENSSPKKALTENSSPKKALTDNSSRKRALTENSSPKKALTENSSRKRALTENSSLKKALTENIPKCSVLLYDVFMDSRLNKLSCPGCSRQYDSTDSIQVNISKATISLLCSGCRWLVVKDVRPHEIISSLAPS